MNLSRDVQKCYSVSYICYLLNNVIVYNSWLLILLCYWLLRVVGDLTVWIILFDMILKLSMYLSQ